MLNQMQQEIVNAVLKGDKRIYMLNGAAGTGKSFTLKYIIDSYPGSILLTATTNKAKDLLASSTKTECITTHNALGFKMIRNGLEEYLCKVRDPLEANLLIIDEYSMMPKALWDSAINGEYKKILLVGDEAQLPAIGLRADITPEVKITLTQQMRQSSNEKLETFMSSLREAIDTKRYIDISTLSLPSNIHLYDKHKDFCKAYTDCKDDKRILAYSNRVVNSYNSNINFKKGKYSVGDLLILNKPLGHLTNGSIVEVVEVVEYDKYFELEVDLISITKKIKVFKTLAAEYGYIDPSINPDEYWRRVDEVYKPKHLYSCTIHKSQGQSIKSVFIDLTDIKSALTRRPTRFNNYNKPISVQDYMKLLYVAISRMQKEAHIFIGDKRDYQRLRTK
ncbi:AAA family ATPase [Campylobacter sp. CLAX-22107-21]|uniref:ATP-dependent DNA helicase n=1 Tax=Campylobacter devanensis TaxID=3161138 RepID=UPI002EA88E92|nr:AAA family ATPase [Campylobacter sp. CLAX-22107-21]